MAKTKQSAPTSKPMPAGAVPPNRDDVLALPFWARIAYVARTARRFLPLVEHCWETQIEINYLRPKGYLRGVRTCIRQVELSAAKGQIVSEEALTKGRDKASNAQSYSEYAAREARRKPDSTQYAASYAASAAMLGATGAFTSIRPAWNCEFGGIVWCVEHIGIAMKATKELNTAVRADYDRLKRLVDEKGLTDQSPVSPTVFGPLWPDGPPKGWPVD